MRVLLLFVALASSASAQIIVTSTADVVADDGECTLREAINSSITDIASGVMSGECVQGAGADVIRFAVPEGSTFTLTADLPRITESLTLEGPTGRADGVTIDGDGQFRLLQFAGQDQTHALRGLTLTGGMTRFGGGVSFEGFNTCTAEDVSIVGNEVTNFAGGVFIGTGMTCVFDRVLIADNESVGSGGGFYATRSSNATLRNATVTRNTAGGGGGGVFVFFNADSGGPASFVLEQSTISGNTSGSGAGGVQLAGTVGTMTVRSVTIVDNATTVDNRFVPGGAAFNGNATIISSVIAGNRKETGDGDPDLSANNGTVSGGNNLIGVDAGNEFPPGLPNANGDFIGDINAPQPAGLAALDNYGGVLPVHLPLGGSPVIDAGVCPGQEFDQRGGPRQLGAACDIGPVEGTVNFVSTEAPVASALRLHAPAPNPTRGAVRMVYETESAGDLSLVVVDALGREVAVLARGEHAAGAHDATLDTARLAPGVYLVRLVGPGAMRVHTVTVVR